MRFAIFGAGGFGREVAPVAEEMLDLANIGAEVVFVSDFDEPISNGRQVLRLSDLALDDTAVIAIGDPAARRAVAGRLEAAGVRLASITAPGHIRYDAVEVGEGAIFCAHTMVTSNVRIGRHFHCNLYSYVAHDCQIGDYVTFAPKVCCNGNVTVGDGAYIGTGALLMPGVNIGAGATIGMGAVVLRDVPAGAQVVGNPARVLTRD